MAAAGIIALVAVTSAHVGSPDVFFQGKAGPYDVSVMIRLPGVVPGLADITVRVLGPGVRRVTVQPVFWQTSTTGAPRPDNALPVPGESGLYSSQLWLMRSGSYSVYVSVEGTAGSGTAFVPLNSLATRRFTMEGATSGVLIGLGLFLFFGLLSIVAAATREASLEPGVSPDPRRRWRARFVTAGAALLLVLAVTGGKNWWDAEDAAYVRRLARPLAAEASVRTHGSSPVLRFTLTDSTWFGGRSTPLIPDHGKMVHLFLVRAPRLDAFAHLHPVRVDSANFEASLPNLPGGTYRVYADFVHSSGFSHTNTDTIEIPAPAMAAFSSSDPDDAWHAADSGTVREIEPVSLLQDGSIMRWQNATEPVKAGRPATLGFSVRSADGSLAVLQPYMAMRGHAAITRGDGSVFVHLHPMGTISMASQQSFIQRATGDTSVEAIRAALFRAAKAGEHDDHGEIPGVVNFPYIFPKAGRYRIWVQVKREGRILTGVFDANVSEAEQKGSG